VRGLVRKVQALNGELSRRDEESARRRRIIEEKEHELRSIRGSKAWKLGCAFQDAKRSWRGIVALPFRLLRELW
jgi:hypothetical protein